jgi:hypothetical protein
VSRLYAQTSYPNKGNQPVSPRCPTPLKTATIRRGSGTDGSVAGDWRLPNVKELESLIDFGWHSPALPVGHPFSVVQSYYWSSTTDISRPDNAWSVNLDDGFVFQ